MDLSATRQIESISTQNGFYFVGNGFDYYDKITTTEKNGDMSYITWYQLWKGGQVIKEVNSLMVIEVNYKLADSEVEKDIPF